MRLAPWRTSPIANWTIGRWGTSTLGSSTRWTAVASPSTRATRRAAMRAKPANAVAWWWTSPTDGRCAASFRWSRCAGIGLSSMCPPSNRWRHCFPRWRRKWTNRAARDPMRTRSAWDWWAKARFTAGWFLPRRSASWERSRGGRESGAAVSCDPSTPLRYAGGERLWGDPSTPLRYACPERSRGARGERWGRGMRIDLLRVHGFGHFANVELALSPALNVVFGPNEAGKSTLLAFVRAVL